MPLPTLKYESELSFLQNNGCLTLQSETHYCFTARLTTRNYVNYNLYRFDFARLVCEYYLCTYFITKNFLRGGFEHRHRRIVRYECTAFVVLSFRPLRFQIQLLSCRLCTKYQTEDKTYKFLLIAHYSNKIKTENRILKSSIIITRLDNGNLWPVIFEHGSIFDNIYLIVNIKHSTYVLM